MRGVKRCVVWPVALSAQEHYGGGNIITENGQRIMSGGRELNFATLLAAIIRGEAHA